jgi:peptidoglycan/LPS O-acetylase OafA/YrhL
MCPSTLGFGGLVLLAVLHPAAFRNRAMRVLAFLGEISYGLYLIHQFVLDGYDHLTAGSWLGDYRGNGLAFLLRPALGISIAVGVATLSRFTLEQTFLNLKGKLAAR